MKKNCFSIVAISFCVVAVTIFIGLALLVLVYFPYTARVLFGEEAPALTVYQKLSFPVRLVLGQQNLLAPVAFEGSERVFTIEPGESVDSICMKLQQNGLITDPDLFRIYLIYSGLDRGIQAGKYKISQPISSVEIGKMLQDATPAEIDFVILPGWRAEEIAASLETSGLTITAPEFMTLVQNPAALSLPQSLVSIKNLEGYLLPGDYVIPRESNEMQLITIIIEKFASEVTPEMFQVYQDHGLTLDQAVIIASMVQREAIHEEEMPLIASVFLNRLSVGMKFDSDATVQYALGHNDIDNTWWKSPLSLADLAIDSPYNTYVNTGFPLGPICNPGIKALQAVAYPAQSSFYYFRAKCDQSGYHNFAETFEQQQQNACP